MGGICLFFTRLSKGERIRVASECLTVCDAFVFLLLPETGKWFCHRCTYREGRHRQAASEII